MFLAKPDSKVSDQTDEISEWHTLADANKLVLPNLKPYLEII